MLRDSERKLLVILSNNLSQKKQIHSWNELLPKMSGKGQKEIKDLLNSLQEQGYIDWDKEQLNTIMILRYNEKPKTQDTGNGNDYFTKY